jgi:hypothetical protein
LNQCKGISFAFNSKKVGKRNFEQPLQIGSYVAYFNRIEKNRCNLTTKSLKFIGACENVHKVLINFYSQFYMEIEWLKHFTTLQACRLDSQWHTFPKWATNVWENVRKLDKVEKCEFNRSCTLSHFLSQ